MATSVTYNYPTFSGNPSTVAPTAVQSSQVNAVTGNLVFADADTTATITHNFGFSVSALARNNPFFENQQLGGGTPSPLFAYQFTSNTVVVSKQSTAAGSGGSTEFKVWRSSQLLPLVP